MSRAVVYSIGITFAAGIDAGATPAEGFLDANHGSHGSFKEFAQAIKLVYLDLTR